ncbi:MAG: SDR family oxidoreductase [Acidimicrobiales bacterium]|nr:SDR family oxidoreductase [Acidimicrobiales bacterium]
MTNNNLSGKVIAITGGARGIGLCVAKQLVTIGAKVAIGDVDDELSKRQAELIGQNCIGLGLDVTKRSSFKNFLMNTTDVLGPLYGLVNNAGVMTLGPFLDQDDLKVQRTIDVNFLGVVIGCKEGLSILRNNELGHIVNVASMGGRIALPGAAVYTGTKFAVIGLTEALRRELKGEQIHISLVLPSLVDTDLSNGVKRGKGMPTVSPDMVANAIVAALSSNKNCDLYIPKWMKGADILSRATPTFVLNAIRDLAGDRRVLSDLDSQSRVDYEKRILN